MFCFTSMCLFGFYMRSTTLFIAFIVYFKGGIKTYGEIEVRKNTRLLEFKMVHTNIQNARIALYAEHNH